MLHSLVHVWRNKQKKFSGNCSFCSSWLHSLHSCSGAKAWGRCQRVVVRCNCLKKWRVFANICRNACVVDECFTRSCLLQLQKTALYTAGRHTVKFFVLRSNNLLHHELQDALHRTYVNEDHSIDEKSFLQVNFSLWLGRWMDPVVKITSPPLNSVALWIVIAWEREAKQTRHASVVHLRLPALPAYELLWVVDSLVG